MGSEQFCRIMEPAVAFYPTLPLLEPPGSPPVFPLTAQIVWQEIERARR